MNLVKCNNGHFYDSERYGSCPHCNDSSGRNDNMTVPMMRGQSGDAVTVAMSGSGSGGGEMTAALSQAPVSVPAPAAKSSLQEAVQSASASGVNVEAASDKTVGFFSHTMGKEPVTGWLVCVVGEHFGEDFKLKSGRNFIGRSAAMDVPITKDTTVSRERHAIVVYEPKGNLFIVQPGDSKELCYLNDEVVLSPREIKIHDRLLVGKTELMFIPCCTAVFQWDQVKPEKTKENEEV